MKLLLVDPNLSVTSPSMKGVVRSLSTLKEQGWEIEAWCWHCDEGLPVDRVVKLPRWGRVSFLGSFAFSLWARLRAWWRFEVKQMRRPELIYSVGWYLPKCDVAHVHFSHWDWERQQQLLGMKCLRDVFERVTNLLNLAWATHFLLRTTARTVLSVSDSVAADLLAVNPELNICVLPNCYDPSRFHAGVRSVHRSSMREKLGFSRDDLVFTFVSAGHYRRKGFFLAVEALMELRADHANAKLLVVGGRPERLEQLQSQLSTFCAGWSEFVTFTGMVPDVERYFAASDAFIFPSYSEAFALVEVEAAACGLPLFLTRHHGSEMILEDGVSGRFIEPDPRQIALVLAEFLKGEWRPASGIHLKRALDSGAYSRAFAQQLSSAVRQATSEPRSLVLSAEGARSS